MTPPRRRGFELVDWDLPERLDALVTVITLTFERAAELTLEELRRRAPRDTGKLARSFSMVRDQPNVIRIVSSHPGALLRSYGGTVKPKRGSYLVIPKMRRRGAASLVGNTRYTSFQLRNGNRGIVDRRQRYRGTMALQARHRGTNYIAEARRASAARGAREILDGMSVTLTRKNRRKSGLDFLRALASRGRALLGLPPKGF